MIHAGRKPCRGGRAARIQAARPSGGPVDRPAPAHSVRPGNVTLCTPRFKRNLPPNSPVLSYSFGIRLALGARVSLRAVLESAPGTGLLLANRLLRTTGDWHESFGKRSDEQ